MNKALLILAILLAAPPVANATAADTADHPKLSVSTVEGQTWQLAEQRGKWVIVNFWATWCSPCIQEMPEIDRFAKDHAEVEAIGLAWEDTDNATVKAFLDEHPVDYPIAVIDPFSPPADFEPPRGLPTTWLIAPDGTVAKKHVGPVTAVDLAKWIGVNPK